MATTPSDGRIFTYRLGRFVLGRLHLALIFSAGYDSTRARSLVLGLESYRSLRRSSRGRQQPVTVTVTLLTASGQRHAEDVIDRIPPTLVPYRTMIDRSC